MTSWSPVDGLRTNFSDVACIKLMEAKHETNKCYMRFYEVLTAVTQWVFILSIAIYRPWRLIKKIRQKPAQEQLLEIFFNF